MGGFKAAVVSEWAQNTNCSTPTWYLNQIRAPAYSGDYTEMSDVTVANYHARVAKGEIFNNPFFRRTRAITQNLGNEWMLRTTTTLCLSKPTTRGEYKGVGPWLNEFVPKQPMAGLQVPLLQYAAAPSDLDRLSTEVSTSVMAKRGSGTLWETVAELEKTVSMFKAPIAKYAKLLSGAERAFRQGRFSRASAEASAQAWLSWRYGIRPILLDIDAISENLKKQLGKIRATTRSYGQESLQTTKTGVSSMGVVQVTWQCQVTDVMTLRGWSLDEYTLDALNQFGFTTKGLLTLPWELTPWSLVADWFVNFGDFLGAIAPTVGWKQLSSGVGVTHVTTNVYTVKSCVSTNNTFALVVPLSGSIGMTEIAKTRNPLSNPGLVVKSNFRFDKFTRAADAMAFAGQLTKMVFAPRSPGFISNLRV